MARNSHYQTLGGFLAFSARDNSKGIEAFIIKHKLREKSLLNLQFQKINDAINNNSSKSRSDAYNRLL